jgi:hypothetical protein
MPLSNSIPFDLGVQRYEIFYKIDLKATSNQIILTVARKQTRKPPHSSGF